MDLINDAKMRSVSLVPKLAKGMMTSVRDISWRYSFNNAEKTLLLDSEPPVANNCRRPVLRILKGLRKDYNWHCIRSYHLKTIMLHEFESHHPSNWTENNTWLCLQKALERLRVFLQNRECPHYFLPGANQFANFSEEAFSKITRDIDAILQNPCMAFMALNGDNMGKITFFS